MQRVAIDAQLQLFVVREEALEGLLDGFAPFQEASGLVGVLAVRRPEGGQGLGIAFVECFDEGFGHA